MARLRTARVNRLLTVAAAAVALPLSCAVAHADVGNMGPGPSPGLCPYPSTCDAGVAGAGIAYYWYREEWPTELNGTHRHCYAYEVATAGNAEVGFSMMLQISAGITGPVGAMVGGCHYVCPDGQLGAMPNPVGGYKDAIIPTRCKPIGPNPDMPVPIQTPIGEQGAVPSVPFGQPQPPAGTPFAPPEPPALPPPPPEVEASPPGPAAVVPPLSPPLAERLPSQTNPACPNPAATTTKGCQ